MCASADEMLDVPATLFDTTGFDPVETTSRPYLPPDAAGPLVTS
jgi:hypothetical protein